MSEENKTQITITFDGEVPDYKINELLMDISAMCSEDKEGHSWVDSDGEGFSIAHKVLSSKCEECDWWTISQTHEQCAKCGEVRESKV